MKQVMRRLELLARMRSDGLLVRLTRFYSEEMLESACQRIEQNQLQDLLRNTPYHAIQNELVRNPAFADLYRFFHDHAVIEPIIEDMLLSAERNRESLTQYPKALLVNAANTHIPNELKFDYMRYFLPIEPEEGEIVCRNLMDFPISRWHDLSGWTKSQRDLFRLPFLKNYLLSRVNTEREALDLLSQRPPLQSLFSLIYQQGVMLRLGKSDLMKLDWFGPEDLAVFQKLIQVFEGDADDLGSFCQYWLNSDAMRTELNWFASQPQPLTPEQRHQILQSSVSYLNTIYAGKLALDFEMVQEYQVPILIYAVEHRKDHFTELVNQNSDLFLSLGRFSLLFEDAFRAHCNINSLTAKHLEACQSTTQRYHALDCLENKKQYTFEELHLLWRSPQIYTHLYRRLTPLSTEQRLITIRQLIKRDLVRHNLDDQALDRLAQRLLEQPFSEWYRNDFGHIQNLSRNTAMQLLLNYEEIQAFIPDLQTETDAIFAAENSVVLSEYRTWQQLRDEILQTDQSWLYLKEKMGLSDEFVAENRKRVTEFLLKGGGAMAAQVYQYMETQGEEKSEALRRIVKAELMGQFYKLKYFTDDLKRELQYPIRKEQEDAWRRNLSITDGRMTAEEVDDFYHTIQLGELPRTTCLSYRNGSQRDCLLAAFDSNKKMILIHYNGKVAARACIRLTKGCRQKPTAKEFSFADLDSAHATMEAVTEQEELVLFLERLYTSGLNDEHVMAAEKLAVALVARKAAEIGVIPVLAASYDGISCQQRYVSAPLYMYISKSKNGKQYLDSLGGAAFASHSEQYQQKRFLVGQAA